MGQTWALQTAPTRAGHWADQLAALAGLMVSHWDLTMGENLDLQKALWKVRHSDRSWAGHWERKKEQKWG